MDSESSGPRSKGDPVESVQVTSRHDRSTLMFVTQHLIKPFKKYTVELPDDRGSKGSPVISPPRTAIKHCHVTHRIIEGMHICDIVHKSTLHNHTERRKRIYYFAGGGWQCSPNATHWTFLVALAKDVTGSTITLVSYPLAPTAAAPATLPHLLRFYKVALKESKTNNETVILAGDSAGGNIVLSLPLIALSEDPDALCPNSILAISPSTNLRRDNPDIDRLQKHDPVLFRQFIMDTAKAWGGNWDLGDPRLSPLFADVTPLARRGVQVHGITGGYDILGPDGILMRQKLNDAGVRGQWLEWDKQMHIFPLLARFKFRESQQAREWIVEVLNSCV